MISKKDIVKEFISSTNQKNWNKVLRLVHEDFVRHSSSEPKEIKTNIGLVNFHKSEAEIFSDLKETILFLIEEGELVAARINFCGTQSGQMSIFPPTGKKLVADYNCFFRITEGKIKETWVEYDNLNGLVQLGHLNLKKFEVNEKELKPAPKEILKKWIEAFNKADVEAISGLYADNAINHQVANEPVVGKNAIRKMFEREFATAEMTCIPENIFEDGEWVILEWKDPNGLRGCGFFQIQNEKIVFQRGYWDKLSFLKLHNLPIE